MVYCGVYDNALDNDNYNLARGFNYHQGPVSGIIIIISRSSGLLVCCLSFTALYMSLYHVRIQMVDICSYFFIMIFIVFLDI